MNLKNKIYDLSINSQCMIEKAKNLAELIMQNIDDPSKCQTCACCVNDILKEIEINQQEIEKCINKNLA